MAGRDAGAFEAFFTQAEPRLRRAFVAAYGPDRGREAAAEALAYGWQHWERIKGLDNLAGYLYRVGQSKTRPAKKTPVFPAAEASSGSPRIEPALPSALESLSERERQAVVLVEGFGLGVREVAALIGVSASSVQSYQQRGLAKLRQALGVSEGA